MTGVQTCALPIFTFKLSSGSIVNLSCNGGAASLAAGELKYSDPREVAVISVTKLVATVATAVADSPALSNPHKKAITVGVLEI